MASWQVSDCKLTYLGGMFNEKSARNPAGKDLGAYPLELGDYPQQPGFLDGWQSLTSRVLILQKLLSANCVQNWVDQEFENKGCDDTTPA